MRGEEFDPQWSEKEGALQRAAGGEVYRGGGQTQQKGEFLHQLHRSAGVVPLQPAERGPVSLSERDRRLPAEHRLP